MWALLLIDFHDGSICLGAGSFIRNSEYVAQGSYGPIPVTWQVSPLGDKVEFGSIAASSGFNVIYEGQVPVLTVDYRGPVYIDLDGTTSPFEAQGLYAQTPLRR